MKKTIPTLLALLTTQTLLITQSVQADTRLIAQITEGKDAPKRTLTLLLKGNQARREASDGSIVLMDREAKKVWVLNTKDKTYWSASLGEYLSPTLTLVSQQRQVLIPHASFKFDTLNVNAPEKAPSPSKIGTAETAQWAISGLFWLQTLSQGGNEGSNRGAGRRGGGSSQRGRVSSPSLSSPSRILMSVVGQLWTDSWDTLTDVPTEAMHDLMLLLTEEMLLTHSPLRQVWQDQMVRKKALPLAATITTSDSNAAPSENPSSSPTTSASSAASPQANTRQLSVVHFLMTSVEKSLTLDSSLFRIPEGFTEIPTPKLPPLSLPR